MGTHKVLVCGSRNYNNWQKIYQVLDAQLAKVGPSLLIISGGASGADTHAREWAVDRRVDHLTLYAKWETEGRKSAGFIRNRRMASKKPKLVLAFSEDFDNSRGTRDMIGVAEKMNIKVKRFS